jgi:hypothetical protein
MDHNEFDFLEDLIKPFTEFIKRIDDSKKRAVGRPNENTANTIVVEEISQ